MFPECFEWQSYNPIPFVRKREQGLYVLKKAVYPRKAV